MICAATRGIGRKRIRMDTGIKQKIIRTVFAVYMAGVLGITFIVNESMNLRSSANRRVVLMPFGQIYALLRYPNNGHWFWQIFLNILLFVPFGVLLPCLKPRFQHFWSVVFAGFLFSAAIESMQFITGRGMTEVDDIINNTAGAAVGFLLYTVFMKLYQKKHGTNP